MPTTTDITALSASRVAHAIAERTISASDAVEACLARIEAVNRRLNALVQSRPEGARADAQRADAAISRGDKLGPLHGVPITIKDAFDVAGMTCTSGTHGRANFVPSADATAVARLRGAGAIVLGLTNTPELTLAYETDNLVYGRTNNPYDRTRTPGGSSGGEAALIASGASYLGLGTDIGGSIRVPAHYCGLAGLKPTLGRVPTTGAFPPAMGMIGGLYHVGPLARSVDDLGLALSVLAGPDGRDWRVAPAPLETRRSERLRVAYYANNGFVPVTPETERAVHSAAQALEAAGYAVVEARPPAAERAFELFPALLGADGGAGVQHLLGMVGTTELSPLLMRMAGVLQPFATSSAGFGGVLVQWDILRAEMLGFMAQFDAVLCPVTASPAPAHGTTLDDSVLPGFSYTMLHSLSGLPTAVVRAGASPEGLPIGVQVGARPWREDVALEVAAQIERNLGGWQPPQ